MSSQQNSKTAKAVCRMSKSGGGEKFKSASGRFIHFTNTIIESHRLYDNDSSKWEEFFHEFSNLNVTDSIESVEQALVERSKIIDSFNLKRKVPQNSAYGFQLFLSASECFAPDWRKSESDRMKWKSFFEICEEWVRKYFPDIVLSVAVHYDEKTPHMHVNLIPIRKNMPVYHNEKMKNPDGSYVLNQKGAIKTKKVMTLNDKGNPILETKYTSGNFMNPEQLERMQTDFANAVRSYGKERRIANSQKKQENLRESRRINARRIVRREYELIKSKVEIDQKNEILVRRFSLINHLLTVPLREFKIKEPERKLLPLLYEWEYKGIKYKNFEEYRNKIIEEQVETRVYQSDLLIKQKTKHIEKLNSALLRQTNINKTLSEQITKMEQILLYGSLQDIEQYRNTTKQRSSVCLNQESVETMRMKNRSL